jgi:hypothetical protein
MDDVLDLTADEAVAFLAEAQVLAQETSVGEEPHDLLDIARRELSGLAPDAAPETMRTLATALLLVRPELTARLRQIRSRLSVRGAPDVGLAQLAIMEIADNLPYLALLVVSLRAIGKNHLAVGNAKYEGESLLADVAQIVDALRSRRPPPGGPGSAS